MANPVWPSILEDDGETGFILENGYSRGPRFKNPNTEMDDGPIWSRRQSRIKARSETIQCLLSAEQAEALEKFAEADLKDATLRFDMPTPNLDGSTTMRTCSFDGVAPDIKPASGGKWLATFTLTVYY